jgi:protoporphyrin/coproporphyrin ferrochelatase
MTRRIAVVLFNLGGPDGPEAVRPFLKNLFSDPAIITAPGPVRWMLARLISTLREKSAQANYARMGGGSPLLPETEAQARALEDAVRHLPAWQGAEVRAFPAMRYWHPFVADVVREVEAFAPTDIVLLPLYPQFSTTTTGSSLAAWREAGGPPAKLVCCYPNAPGFLAGHRDAILDAWDEGGQPLATRILWSAHGLPQKTIDAGDPYQRQVEETVAAVQALLPDHFEHRICYQSRVGPLKWIGPSTEEAIAEAGRDKVGVLVTPIAFVSEHIETLVELDEEYREKAHEAGVPFYLRAAALGTRAPFIEALAQLVGEALEAPGSVIAKREGNCGTNPCPACPRAAFEGCGA